MKTLKHLIPLIALLLITGTAFAAFYPSGGSTYRLSSSVGSTDTVINLSSFKEPVSNIPYTMSYLNSSIECGTLDPQNSNSEFISFTGITQNSNGSAQLTGVSRGLGRSYPYTASTTLASAHAGASIFILSDAPCLFQQYAAISNPETITGNWDVPFPADSNSVVPRSYVDGTAFSGIGGASESATGTVQIATGAQAAASTKNGTLGRLVLPSSLSTSTWSASIPVGTIPVVGTVGGKLDPNFIPTPTLASTTVIGSTNALAIGKTEFATSTSGTWTVPNGITKVFVRMVGGGGASGNSSSAGCTSGGGSGGYAEFMLSVSSTLAMTIGQGGATTTSTGSAGGATIVGGITANGGGGGLANVSPPSTSGGGAGGSVTGSTMPGTATSTGTQGGTCVNENVSSGVFQLNGLGAPSVLGMPGSGGNGGGGGNLTNGSTGNPGEVILTY